MQLKELDVLVAHNHKEIGGFLLLYYTQGTDRHWRVEAPNQPEFNATKTGLNAIANRFFLRKRRNIKVVSREKLHDLSQQVSACWIG